MKYLRGPVECEDIRDCVSGNCEKQNCLSDSVPDVSEDLRNLRRPAAGVAAKPTHLRSLVAGLSPDVENPRGSDFSTDVSWKCAVVKVKVIELTADSTPSCMTMFKMTW